MTFYAKDYIEKLIDPASQAPKKQFTVAYHNYGPALCDKWLSLIQGEDGFIHRETSPPQAPRKKLIFSNYLLNKTAPTESELGFISALIRYYDVYLWAGDEVSFAECKPVTSSGEFWKKLTEVKPATQKKVEESFTAQGMATENCIFLDYAKYYEALQKSDKDANYIQNPNKLNLGYLKSIPADKSDELELELQRIKASVDVTKIKELIYPYPPSPQEMEFASQFPNLNNIKCDFDTFSFDSTPFGHLKKKINCQITHDYARPIPYTCNDAKEGVTLPFLDTTNNTILSIMPTEEKTAANRSVNLTDQILAYTRDSTGFTGTLGDEADSANLESSTGIMRTAPRGRYLKRTKRPVDRVEQESNEQQESGRLNRMQTARPFGGIEQEYRRVPPKKIYQPLPQLKRLKIGAEEVLQEVDFSLFPELEELEIYSPILTQLDLTPCRNLKTLYITNNGQLNAKLKEIKLDLPKLEMLDLTCNNLTTLDLTKLPHLKRLRLYGLEKSANLLLNSTSLSELETIEIEYSKFVNLDLSKLPKLKKVILNNCQGDINLSDNPSLVQVKLSSNCELVNIQGCTALQRCEIYNENKCNTDIQGFETCTQLQQVILKDIDNGAYYETCLPKNCQRTIMKPFTNKEQGDPKFFQTEMPSPGMSQNLGLSTTDNKSQPTMPDKTLSPDMLRGFLELLSLGNPSNPAESTPPSSESKNTESPGMMQYLLGLLSLGKQTKIEKPTTTLLSELKNIDMKLHQENEDSPTALLSFIDSVNIDSNTDVRKTALQVSSNYKVTLNMKNKVDRDLYRVTILDDVTFSEQDGVIQFKTAPTNYTQLDKKPLPFDSKMVETLNENVQKDESLGLGHIEAIDLDPNRFYPLPTQHTLDPKAPFEIFCNPKDAIQIFWNASHQQYYFKLTSKKIKNVEVLYQFKKNPHYDLQSNQVIQEQKNLLPQRLYDIIADEIKKNKKLAFLIDEKKDLTAKLKSLKTFCQQFKNTSLSPSIIKTLLSTLENKDIDLATKIQTLKDNSIQLKNTFLFLKLDFTEIFAFLDSTANSDSAKLLKLEEVGKELRKHQNTEEMLLIMREGKGACRHRSEIFMLLARYLGVPARMVRNELHRFCEIPYGKDPQSWHRFNLGGAPSIDQTPRDKRKNIFETLNKPAAVQKNKSSTIQVEDKKELPPAIDEDYEKYAQHFQDLIQKNTINSILGFLDKKSAMPPLLELTAEQSPLDVSKAIANELRTAQRFKNYIYIHRPEDFHQFLHPYKFENGIRKQCDGPLADLLKEGGTLVVNWSSFSSKQIASFKSILDAKPTLLGKPLSDKVCVIGLKTPSTEACSAFYSRCQSHLVHSSYLSKNIEFKETKTPQAPITIDLFGRLDWRESLFGKIELSGNKIHIKKGPLIEAIEKNSLITILNPPQDEAFTVLLRRIQDERQLLYFDKMLKVPDDFQINTRHEPHPNMLPNVAVSYISSEEQIHDRRNVVYLNIHNIHECLEKLIIETKDNTAKADKGFLDSKTSFYVTETISQSDWQQLLHYIDQHQKSKNFNFYFGPGAVIEGFNVDKVSAPPQQIDKNSPIIFSNDPDFHAQELQKEHKEIKIIDVSPHMGFHDLVAKLEIKSQTDKPEAIDFIYQTKAFVEELKKGTKIILNGELSPILYQQLLPLLSSSPHIDINGERLEAKPGQLLAIMPTAAKKNLPLFHFAERNYSVKDYRDKLEDKSMIDKIEQFYQLAAKMPHIGMGRPESPTLSFARLSRMVKALKNPKRHLRNPIKGIFLYDYPKQSEDYAYLNIAAKYLFTELDDKSVDNVDKLKRLNIKTIADIKKNQWRCLNCLSPNQLRNVLGKDWKGEDLSENNIEKLFNFVNSTEQKEEKAKTKKSSVAKREQQLKELLEDENSSLIMLKGPAGVGKSYTIRQLQSKLNFETFEGNEQIIEWLKKTSSDKYKVLLLDEANLYKPGTWDMFKGLCRDGKVFYQGKEYTLTPQHKIIATGNPETYPERFYHPLFQHYAETLYFKMPENEYIENEILLPILNPQQLNEYNQKLIQAYHLICELNPTYVYSFRDLESLALRFCLLAEDRNDLDQKFLQACLSEFSGTILSIDKRNEFSQRLQKEFKIDSTIQSNDMEIGDILIPKQYALLVDGIEQDLRLREKSLESKTKLSFKPGILIEGQAGLGKSTLLETMLIKHGYTKDSVNTNKKYYVISAGEPDAHKLLLQAFNQGSAVVLDELNLDEKLEKLLNQLLTGQDPQGKSADKPGFMVLASQNPSHEKGRKSLSPALRNRMHVYFMEPHNHESLLSLAQKKIKDKPDSFVKAFEMTREKNPFVNTRTFHHGLQQISSGLRLVSPAA